MGCTASSDVPPCTGVKKWQRKSRSNSFASSNSSMSSFNDMLTAVAPKLQGSLKVRISEFKKDDSSSHPRRCKVQASAGEVLEVVGMQESCGFTVRTEAGVVLVEAHLDVDPQVGVKGTVRVLGGDVVWTFKDDFGSRQEAALYRCSSDGRQVQCCRLTAPCHFAASYSICLPGSQGECLANATTALLFAVRRTDIEMSNTLPVRTVLELLVAALIRFYLDASGAY